MSFWGLCPALGRGHLQFHLQEFLMCCGPVWPSPVWLCPGVAVPSVAVPQCGCPRVPPGHRWLLPLQPGARGAALPGLFWFLSQTTACPCAESLCCSIWDNTGSFTAWGSLGLCPLLQGWGHNPGVSLSPQTCQCSM